MLKEDAVSPLDAQGWDDLAEASSRGCPDASKIAPGDVVAEKEVLHMKAASIRPERE